MQKKDTLYTTLRPKQGSFVFDRRVAAVFEDMVERSVPGYRDVVAMTGLLAARYARKNTRVYDLGTSLGASALAASAALYNTKVKIVAVDSSQAMLEKLKKRAPKNSKIILRCEDIRMTPIEQASFVILNYTLQFIPRGERAKLLKKIYKNMVPGGALLLSEKIAFSDSTEERFQNKLHETFKREQGYSHLEISRKRTALERVLIPEKIKTHRERLRRAGFRSVSVWFRCFNFASFIAVK